MFGARHECFGFYCLYVYCSGFNVKCKYVWSVTEQAPLTLPLSQLVTLKLHTLPDKLGLLPQCHSSI